jgi:hypothetical protein
MTFDYNWESLVGTLPLVLITGIPSLTFTELPLEPFCGKTRVENHDVVVIVDKKDDS